MLVVMKLSSNRWSMRPIVVPVLPNEIVPLLRRFVEREDRLDRARRHAGAAVDALVGMNIKHLSRGELGLVLPGMNAVDRADVHARSILDADAWLADDIRHHTHHTRDSGDPESVALRLDRRADAERAALHVRSRFDGVVHARAARARALRGVHDGPANRGRSGSARGARRVRRGRLVRSRGAAAALWRRTRAHPAQLDRLIRRIRLDDAPVAVSGRVAHPLAAGDDGDPLETGPLNAKAAKTAKPQISLG